MVTTRRQSKTIDPPVLPPVAPPKRKRSDDAASEPGAAQAPNQPSTKRRKKVKSTAKVDLPVATRGGPAPMDKKEKKSMIAAARRKARKQAAQAKKAPQPKTNNTDLASSQKTAHRDSTNDHESSEDEAPRPPRPAASQDADDEDVDSRYALGSKRKGKAKKPAASIARRTAELRFEEDGLEEVDKAQVAVADANNRMSKQTKKPGSMPWTPINEMGAVEKDKAAKPSVSGKGAEKKGNVPQVNRNGVGKAKAVKRKVPPAAASSQVVMFTIAEAIAALSSYKDGTMSMAAEIDPESRQPYEALQTGEYLSYPVKNNYHLGALGRYGIKIIPPPSFSLTVPLSEYSFIESTSTSSTTAPTRHGLGFTALPARSKAPTVRRPNNYCFTFGRNRGRRMDSVPLTYLRSIFEGDEYYADMKLQQAFADLYPKGLYENETESFMFEKGGFKGKRFDEVPKSYLWGLIRKKGEGAEVGGKKGRKALERALEAWEKKQLDLTKE
ncbi:uncharacterized protein M421DRAFT_338163 [Didymella exigua CBS 183.55]|uniref:Uncharacterized protein n=1 Tax=Didymella exigua CBS 183.55 TaxID=1150837 RepID=A0A6A5RAK7_9PLEO|nr:uncharacterized protein M421DRAFT_338163 [Didymella exigua CBS 183.55]KAF1922847.1 hypothetical protein M421DRAFT_338163 [Didymella exigua CBS 183.55]